MNNTKQPLNLTAQSVCYNCELAVDLGDRASEYFQEGMGLQAAWAHSECATPTLQGRLHDSLAGQFGLNPLPTAKVPAHPWRQLKQIVPGGAEVFANDAGEIVAVKSRWDSSETVESETADTLAIARAFGLSISPILAAPWLIDEEPALAFTSHTAAVRDALRSQNPQDRCFACGYDVPPDDRGADFAAVGLGRAHVCCLTEARELAWHEFSLQWGIHRYDGPWCLHLLGQPANAVENQRHAQWCVLTQVQGERTMDHPRAWTVASDSPWTAFVQPGSLLVTSEPYHNESLQISSVVSADGEPLDVFVYPEVHLHNTDIDNGLATELHLWLPHHRPQAA